MTSHEIEYQNALNKEFETSHPCLYYIFEAFERSNDPEDYITAKEIIDFLQEKEYKAPSTRAMEMEIANAFRSIDIQKKRKQVNDNKTMVYTGIRRIL